jgi:hypothetical protein
MKQYGRDKKAIQGVFLSHSKRCSIEREEVSVQTQNEVKKSQITPLIIPLYPPGDHGQRPIHGLLIATRMFGHHSGGNHYHVTPRDTPNSAPKFAYRINAQCVSSPNGAPGKYVVPDSSRDCGAILNFFECGFRIHEKGSFVFCQRIFDTRLGSSSS